METSPPHGFASHSDSRTSSNHLATTNKKPAEELSLASTTVVADPSAGELLPASSTTVVDSTTKNEFLPAPPTTTEDPTTTGVKREYSPTLNQQPVNDKDRPRLNEEDEKVQTSCILQDNRKPRESVNGPPPDPRALGPSPEKRCPTCKQTLQSPTAVFKRTLDDLDDIDTHGRDTKRHKSDNSLEPSPLESKEKEHIADWVSSVLIDTDDLRFKSISCGPSPMAPRLNLTLSNPDFRLASDERGIYVQSIDIQPALRQRAEGIIGRELQTPDSIPDLDVVTSVQSMVRDREEDYLRRVLVPVLVPGYSRVPQGLEMSAVRQWRRCMPVLPVDSQLKPLPDPEAEMPYGYSIDVFTSTQRSTIGHFKSYVEPVARVYFPFFNFDLRVEWNGGMYAGENQCANVGAVAMQGFVELARRAEKLQNVDLNEPQFFSLTTIARSARLHVHWLGMVGTEGQVEYYMRDLQSYDLGSRNDVASLRRAILNIYDWAQHTRLPRIQELLDEYQRLLLPPPARAARAVQAA